jgi:tRNA (guanine37-N1)-methyltransferase
MGCDAIGCADLISDRHSGEGRNPGKVAMRFVVLTLFPELFDTFRNHGMIRRAVELQKISVQTIQIRDFAEGRHQVADDRPYGGGPGMVMKPEPLAGALRAAMMMIPDARKIHLTPQGRPFSNTLARQLAKEKELVLLCGRYEGIDERICQNFIDDEVSIGDYILTGGELAAMVLIDAVSRFIPGVLGCADSPEDDSFSDRLLEHAHYTRPFEFEGESVPEVLLSGDHGRIEQWRLQSSIVRTLLKRKDLLLEHALTSEELKILKDWQKEIQLIIDFQQKK